MKTLVKMAIAVLVIAVFQELNAQSWDKIMPDILYAKGKFNDTANIKVGIGVKYPIAKLQVAGDIKTDKLKCDTIISKRFLSTDSIIYFGLNSLGFDYNNI